MSRKLRWGLIGLGVFLGISAIAFLGLYLALRYEPKFYRQALQADRAVLEKGSKKMLHQSSALLNHAHQDGSWNETFTAQQINGWLAVDFVQNYPNTLPSTMRDPRVEITPDGITAACRSEYGALSFVLSLTLKPYVPQSSPVGRNVVALRIIRVRAGLLPLPLDDVLKTVRRSVQQSGCRLEWRTAGGDPVAIITLPPPGKNAPRVLSVESIRLGEGEISIAGNTQPQK